MDGLVVQMRKKLKNKINKNEMKKWKNEKKTLALFVKRVILSAGAMLIFSVSFLQERVAR